MESLITWLQGTENVALVLSVALNIYLLRITEKVRDSLHQVNKSLIIIAERIGPQ